MERVLLNNSSAFNINHSMPSIQKLLSEKGKPMTCYLGHIYTKEKATEVKIIFRCQNRSCKEIFYRNNESKELSTVVFCSTLSYKFVNGYFSL